MSVQYFDIDGAEVAVCSGPPVREHSRTSMGVRWCFKCRGRHEFAWVVMASDIVYDANGDIDPVMYMAEPYAHSECSNCKQHAGELFPGWTYAEVES